jgi:ABC-2 type transport system ATP-binding protein
MGPIIKAEGLAKTYRIGFFRKKVYALKNSTFEVNPNEIFGLVGPNGAGKTTTIKILTGLVKQDKGQATLLGKPVGVPQARRELGYLPEGPYFYEYLNVRELLDLHGSLCGLSRGLRTKRAEELIERVGLSHALDRPLRKFSKGMLQRAGLACALIHDPKLVILDEPKSGLDPIGRAEISKLIQDLKDQGKSVFFASHILADVEKICDRVAVMMKGRVVDIGTMDKLLDAKVVETEIDTEGLNEEFRSELESMGMSWKSFEGGRVTLVGDNPGVAQVALKKVVGWGAYVRGYDERHESLEDLFLKEVEISNENQS